MIMRGSLVFLLLFYEVYSHSEQIGNEKEEGTVD